MDGQFEQFVSRSADETLQLGRELAEKLVGGELILLRGPMGAGKSVLARGILTGLGASHWRGSPTYTIVNEYEGWFPAYHVDLYRLDAVEAEQLGLEEMVRDQSIVVVEWPERAEAYLRSLAVDGLVIVDLSIVGPEERNIHIHHLISS